MTNQTPQSGGGIGLGGVLFIVFLVLKLTDTIDWSWWWVTAPLWGPVALILVGLLLIGLPLMIKADKHAAKSWHRNVRKPR